MLWLHLDLQRLYAAACCVMAELAIDLCKCTGRPRILSFRKPSDLCIRALLLRGALLGYKAVALLAGSVAPQTHSAR